MSSFEQSSGWSNLAYSRISRKVKASSNYCKRNLNVFYDSDFKYLTFARTEKVCFRFAPSQVLNKLLCIDSGWNIFDAS